MFGGLIGQAWLTSPRAENDCHTPQRDNATSKLHDSFVESRSSLKRRDKRKDARHKLNVHASTINSDSTNDQCQAVPNPSYWLGPLLTSPEKKPTGQQADTGQEADSSQQGDAGQPGSAGQQASGLGCLEKLESLPVSQQKAAFYREVKKLGFKADARNLSRAWSSHPLVLQRKAQELERRRACEERKRSRMADKSEAKSHKKPGQQDEI